MSKEGKIVLIQTMILVGSMLSLYILFSSTVYNCDNVNKEVLSNSLNTCFEKQSKTREAEVKETAIVESFKLQKLKERHRFCEELIKSGQKTCEKEKETISSIMTTNISCHEEVKRTICKPRMFLWKLWFF